jgi:alpha-L-fucosidase
VDRSEPSPARREYLATLSALGLGGLTGCGSNGGDENDAETSTDEKRSTTVAETSSASTTTVPPAADSTPQSYEAFQTTVDGTLTTADAVLESGPYETTWDSLSGVEPAPEWFRDAKFGLYFHLGPYAVPAFDSEWYPRNMYDRGDDVNNHHTREYGDPSEFPYQRFVPEYSAENFEPEALASLFESAGARFGGMVAKHADGWSNWDSAINPWNAGDLGPTEDLVGEFGVALRDRGLRFVTTFHHAFTHTFDYYEYAFEHYPAVTEGYPDRVMYGNLPAELFHDQWLAEIIETIDRDAPDLEYLDSGLGRMPATDRRRTTAYA